jgi:hypothetical protein
LHRQLPVELVRGDRLGLAGHRRHVACTPGFAALPRLGSEAPNPAAAAVQALRRPPGLAPACAGGATALGNILLDLRLHLLRGVSWGTGGPAEPLLVATARDLQEPTETTAGKLRVRLSEPRVLHGSGGAQYAAAFWKIAHSSCKRAFSFRRRCSSAESGSSWTCFSWRSPR